jgi:hypothetical protein
MPQDVTSPEPKTYIGALLLDGTGVAVSVVQFVAGEAKGSPFPLRLLADCLGDDARPAPSSVL